MTQIPTVRPCSRCGAYVETDEPLTKDSKGRTIHPDGTWCLTGRPSLKIAADGSETWDFSLVAEEDVPFVQDLLDRAAAR